MGGPFCFEELSARHTGPQSEGRPTDWHRDRPHWPEHPLNLDYPQVIYYLTDVDEGTHCFTISPEPAAGPLLLDKEAHLARGGTVYFHGRAGSAILFNCATLHDPARGHAPPPDHPGLLRPPRPFLSQVTLMSPRLWRDHPDPEIRRFYGKLNRYTRVWLGALGIATP